MENLEKLAKACASPRLARLAKRVMVFPRYAGCVQVCRAGFRRFSDQYPQKTLFIAGLPKSGTTWLEKMLASYPGFHELVIPDVAAYELVTGGSHDYNLPDDMFSRFRDMLVVTKMHVHGSPHNVRLLHEAGIRYVVLYRDLRDVAVSHYFYVRQTPWHPEYTTYSTLSLQEGLAVFGVRLLPAFVKWVRSWHENGDLEMGLILRYEDMLDDTVGVMTRVAAHFELDSSPGMVGEIVESHSFKRLSGGRNRGQESRSSFFRKGKAGDWQSHFTPELKEMYKQVIGDFLIEFGYEQDCDW